MNILLVNDDGIDAQGLSVLFAAVQDLGTITIVAPDGERSAVSHSITLDKPMPLRRFVKDGLFEGYALRGTPADCVKLALTEIMSSPPDLVISGINLGSNTGLNVIYSGTVGGAAEAVFNGIPGIAISLTTYEDPNWEPAAHFIRYLVQTMKNDLPRDVMLNVNVPNVRSASDIAGVRICEQGMAQWKEKFDKRTDPKGRTYYWMSGIKKELDEAETIDETAVKNNYISLTPIRFNLTAHDKMNGLKKLESDYQKNR
ncbi:MAG: 5'/3'-nucleotidase SurE [FCB group bacterium]|nr:5'/3'-nucleotidase SurE [FCB group bacterium]